jgi:hypothetical protein
MDVKFGSQKVNGVTEADCNWILIRLTIISFNFKILTIVIKNAIDLIFANCN